MKILKSLHSFDRALLAAFLFLLAVAVGSSLTGCGSIKKVEKSEVKTHDVEKSDSVASDTKTTETKYYGDTLTGQTAIALNADTAKSDTASIPFHVESSGISLSGTFRPILNNGKITGADFNYKAIAKPTAKTDTHDVAKGEIKKTTAKTTTATDNTKTTTKVGFAIPWYCWLILIALLLIAGIFFYNKIKSITKI